MARSFNGTSDYITTTFSGQLNDFTCSTWFLATGLGSKGYDRVVDKTYNFGFWIGRDNSVSNSWGGGILQSSSPFGLFVTLTDGSWHNLINSRSGSTQTIYADSGAASASQSCSNSALNSDDLFIGNEISNGAPFAGKIAEVVVWNVSLSAGEMNALGKGCSAYTIRPQSIVGYWPLWGLTSPEPDLSGNANNGVLTGTAYATHAPVTLFTPRSPGQPILATAAASKLFRTTPMDGLGVGGPFFSSPI